MNIPLKQASAKGTSVFTSIFDVFRNRLAPAACNWFHQTSLAWRLAWSFQRKLWIPPLGLAGHFQMTFTGHWFWMREPLLGHRWVGTSSIVKHTLSEEKSPNCC